MRRKTFNLFDLSVEVSMTGRMRKRPHSHPTPTAAEALIADYSASDNVNVKIEKILALRRLAVQGDEEAIEFILATLTNTNTQSSVLFELFNALREISTVVKTAKIYFVLAQCYMPTQIFSHNIPHDPLLALKMLEIAASLPGEYGMRAAYTLVYLYADTLGYLSYNHPLSFQRAYDYVVAFNNPDMFPTFLYLTRIYASLGTVAADNNLFRWYTNGYPPYILPDENALEKCTTAIDEHKKTAIERFLQYYERAIAKTIAEGTLVPQDANANYNLSAVICCFVYHCRQISPDENAQSDPQITKRIFADVRNRFIEAANQGNLCAAEFLAIKADDVEQRSAYQLKKDDATFWNNFIIDKAPSTPLAMRANRRLFVALNITVHPTLVAAYQLGCTASAVDLGNVKLRLGEIYQAFDCFDFALRNTTDSNTAKLVFFALSRHKWKTPVCLPYYLQVYAEVIKRSCDIPVSILNFYYDFVSYNPDIKDETKIKWHVLVDKLRTNTAESLRQIDHLDLDLLMNETAIGLIKHYDNYNSLARYII